MPADRLPCSPAQLSSIVDSMEQMKSKPFVLSVLANQLYCSEDVPTNSKEQDAIDFECGILEQRPISHNKRTNKHSNANSFSKSLEFTDKERSEVECIH